jgi:hypothetical protein
MRRASAGNTAIRSHRPCGGIWNAYSIGLDGRNPQDPPEPSAARLFPAPPPVAGRQSARPSQNGSTLADDPIMGCAACRSRVLDFPQPMERFAEGEFEAVGIALSAVDRLDRLLPAWSLYQFDREHPSGCPLGVPRPNHRGLYNRPRTLPSGPNDQIRSARFRTQKRRLSRENLPLATDPAVERAGEGHRLPRRCEL